jgi:hypothetical protein
MPPKDKLKSLLSKQERKVPDAIRLKEMNEVRNYNRNQQQKVYDSEIRQVSAEQEAIKPASAKDVGSAFKLQVYILKLNQILQLKQETYQSLGLALDSLPKATPEQIAAAAQGGPGSPAQAALTKIQSMGKLSALTQTRGTEGALATQFFSKADLLAAFNEMMAFIKTYMPDLTGDNRQLEQVKAAYFTPLKNLLVTVQGLYPEFFENIPEPRPAAQRRGESERQTYELLRNQSMYMYSLMGCMADFLEDENLRPIVASDITLFIRENDVREIFVANPLADGLRSQAVSMNIRAQQQALAAAAAQQAAQAAAGPRGADMAAQLQQQAQQGLATTAEEQARQQLIADAAADVQGRMQPPPADARFTGWNAAHPEASERLYQRGFRVAAGAPLRINDAVAEFVRQKVALGTPNTQVFRDTRADDRPAAIRFVANSDFQPAALTGVIRAFVAGNQQFKQNQGRPRIVIPPGGFPGQQGGPAQPAQQPAQDPRTVAQFAQFDTNDAVPQALGIQRGTPEYDVTQTMINAIKGAENSFNPPRVVNAKSAADVRAVYDILDARNRPEYEQMFPTENAKIDRIRVLIRAMRDARIAFSQAQNLPATSERELHGMGLPELKKFVDKKGMFPSKMNPKHVAHFMKLNIPPEMVFKLMKKHGIRDGALMEEMQGSGIFDSLKDMAKGAFNSVKDSASGWADTISKNMPDMSDVRRAVGKIVPDSFQKHMPDGLKQTFGDKAKNFFGFGATEAGGIPNRHREPFSAPNLDKYGYRQGAAQRMRIMPVDMEMVSGLHKLKGGDQLRDTDTEVMRRKDHHDVDVPVAYQQSLHGYGVDGDEDDQMEGGLKGRLMGMPLSMFAPRGGRKEGFIPMFSGGELDPYADKFEGGAEGFYEEEEKPYDHDENPTPFRVRNENHAVNTGKLKKVTYKD